MQAILSLAMGYFIGCVSPAALLGKLKHVDLKQEGTKNLGATNTAIVLGRSSGIFVMLFDIFKSWFSAKLAKALFPQLAVAGLIACIGCILGHCFPVFLHFMGGKGLAAYGGMVLAHNPWFFLIIVVPGVILMTLLNTGVAVPMLASVMYPLLTWFWSHSISQTLLALLASGIIVVMHLSNLKKALARKDVVKTRDFYKNILFKKKDPK